MPFPLLLRALVSLSASARYLSDLIADLFDSTSASHSYQSPMFHALMGQTCNSRQRTWCQQIQQDTL
ncbi:MAG: hypothetical protein OJF50_001764 [Nitrospira sp.]|nr:hypothetical protein [Nitrospira sp.]